MKFLKIVYDFFMPLFYRKKDYNLIILRYDDNKFMFNSKVFFEYLIKNSNFNIRYIINDEELKEKLISKYGNYFITNKTFTDSNYIAKAGTWITDGGFPLKTPFGHKNRLLINFWHGTTLKYIGLKGYRGISKLRVKLQLLMYSKYYDLFAVSNKKFIKIIKESFLIEEKNIRIVGQPRNDNILKYQNKKLIYKYITNLPKFDKIILYAPTFRVSNYGNAMKNKQITKFFPFNDMDYDDLEKFLEENKLIIFIRPHHLEKNNVKFSKRVILLDDKIVADISEILGIFDLIITDYAGIIFEFLLTLKPQLFLPYDLETYEEEIGLNFNYNDVSPGPKPINFTEFKKEILKLLQDKNYYLQERKKVNEKMNEIKNGSSDLIFNILSNKIKEYNI